MCPEGYEDFRHCIPGSVRSHTLRASRDGDRRSASLRTLKAQEGLESHGKEYECALTLDPRHRLYLPEKKDQCWKR